RSPNGPGVHGLAGPRAQLQGVYPARPGGCGRPLIWHQVEPPDVTLLPSSVSLLELRAWSVTWSVVDETQLIARVRAGDSAAERALYDAHVDRVYRLAFRLAGDDT